jgi:hypothetical protein
MPRRSPSPDAQSNLHLAANRQRVRNLLYQSSARSISIQYQCSSAFIIEMLQTQVKCKSLPLEFYAATCSPRFGKTAPIAEAAVSIARPKTLI